MTTTPGEKRQLAATAVRIKDHPSLSSFQAGRGSEPTPGSQPHRLDMRVLWLTKALIVWMRHKLSPSPSVDHRVVEYLELEGTHKDHPISWLYTGLLKKCLLGCITKTVCSRWGELILPPPPLCSEEATSGVLCPILGSLFKKNRKLLERVQWRQRKEGKASFMREGWEIWDSSVWRRLRRYLINA